MEWGVKVGWRVRVWRVRVWRDWGVGGLEMIGVRSEMGGGWV